MTNAVKEKSKKSRVSAVVYRGENSTKIFIRITRLESIVLFEGELCEDNLLEIQAAVRIWG